jgi:heme/copper-type cytochrome/quinol oxidase subunit 1
MIKPSNKQGRWTHRFIIAAIIQGAIIVGLTLFLIIGDATILNPQISRVIAAGNAGTWFTFGYTMYITVGVIGVAVSAIFYHYLEQIDEKYYQNTYSKILASVHLVLMNIGSFAAMGMMMYVGYIGGSSMLPEAVGGKGYDAAQAHELMAPFVDPIGISILVLLVGVLAGGLGFVISYRRNTAINV